MKRHALWRVLSPAAGSAGARAAMKRITPLEPLLTRTDPEGLVVDGGVRVYDNRLAVSDDPRPKACVGVACSQGLWMSDPGL